MKVISISTDRKIFDKESAVYRRMIEYGKLFEELHIIIFTRKTSWFKSTKIADNVWAYPTNSLSRFLYTRDAVTIGKNLAAEQNLYGESHNVVVSTQDPFETGKAGSRLRALLNCGLQIQIHTDLLSHYFVAASLLNRIRVSIARHLLPEADEIRVVSARIKQSIMKLLPHLDERKINVLSIYPNFDQAYSEHSASGGENLKAKYPQFNFIILMASRLSREKNIGLALEAFKKVRNVHKDAGLVIVGSGWRLPELKTKARASGLRESVIFESWQNNLASYYKSADAFLSASLYEGYGLTLVEAALSGLPIVTTDVGIVGDVLINGQSALVCPINNADCLAQNIIHLIEHKDAAKKLSAAALESVHKHIPASRDEYLTKYRESVARALKTDRSK